MNDKKGVLLALLCMLYGCQGYAGQEKKLTELEKLKNEVEALDFDLWKKRIGIKPATKKKLTKKDVIRAARFHDEIPLIFSGEKFFKPPSSGKNPNFLERDVKLFMSAVKSWDTNFIEGSVFQNLFTYENWGTKKEKRLKLHEKKISDIMDIAVEQCLNQHINSQKICFQQKIRRIGFLKQLCSYPNGAKALKAMAHEGNQDLCTLLEEVTSKSARKQAKETWKELEFDIIEKTLQQIILCCNPKAQRKQPLKHPRFSLLKNSLRKQLLSFNSKEPTEKQQTLKKLFGT